MIHLHVFTENNLGPNFWARQTNSETEIIIQPIDITVIYENLQAGGNFILVDFYFTQIPEEREWYLTRCIKEMAQKQSHPVYLFFVSPTYSIRKPKLEESSFFHAYSHNYSEAFLNHLKWTSKNLILNNHYKAS